MQKRESIDRSRIQMRWKVYPSGHSFSRRASTILTQGDPSQSACVPVFNVEYVLNLAPDAYAKSYAHGFVPDVTRSSLGALTTTPPPDSLKTDAPK
ncbi:MAG TPA: hypothetical protein VK201_04005 [bacterium]|nr:hypothetical protein [bacterium]